jgi:hypothetical protein
MGCDKKCKKNCKRFTYYYDAASLIAAAPVPDVYSGVGGDQSYSVFVHGQVFSDSKLTSLIGTIEINNKVLQNTSVNPPKLPRIVSTATLFLLDGVSSINISLFYISKTLIPTVSPGTFKTIAYGTTGIYYDKTCYVTDTAPSTGSIITLTLKVYDNTK